MVSEIDFTSFCNCSKRKKLDDLGPQTLRRRLPRTSSFLHVLPPLISNIILGILHNLRQGLDSPKGWSDWKLNAYQSGAQNRVCSYAERFLSTEYVHKTIRSLFPFPQRWADTHSSLLCYNLPSCRQGSHAPRVYRQPYIRTFWCTWTTA